MTMRWLTAAAVVLGVSGSASADQLVSTTLNASNHTTGAQWDINGDYNATINIRATAVGTLQQTHGIRACLYKADGTPVAWAEVIPGQLKQIQVALTTGTYFFIFDLGAQNISNPIGSVNLSAEGTIINPLTGLPVPTKKEGTDLPPDPYYPEPSWIWLDGPIPMRLDTFIPVHGWGPTSETMIYLVDWT
jgi:hypothetical protein